MRAISMRRLVGGAAALTLIGSTLLATAGGVTAGQTRILDIRSPGQVDPGSLSFSEVGPGGVTKTDVVVTNNGKQNLTKAHLLIGAPDGADLPADFSIADVFGLQGAGTCSFSATTLDCDFGSLTSKGPGKTRQVSIAFNVGAATSTSAIVITIKVAENVQDVGSNTNFQQASGTPTVDGANCHGYATYVLSIHGDLPLAPAATGCAQDQLSSLGLKANSDGGSNGFARFDDSAPAVCTVSGLSCFGFVVDATVHDNQTITPYLIWTITYSAALMHNVNPKQVAFQHGSDPLLTAKKNTCGTDFAGKDCIAGYQPNEDGSVTFTIWTSKNSTIRGLH
jgi:hypothetical protein